MKQLIIIILFLPFAATAQLSANQKKQVTTMIATDNKKQQAEINWLRANKTKDSLKMIKFEATLAFVNKAITGQVSNRSAGEIDQLPIDQFLKAQDSIISFWGIRMQTMNKNVGFVVSETERVTAELKAVTDSLTAIKKIIPPIFKTKVADGLTVRASDSAVIIDPVIYKKLLKL